MSNSTIAFRLSSEEIAALDRVAAKRSCSRSEAARTALMVGIRFAEAEHTFNITRAVLVLEYMQAAIDVIITRDHGDVVPQLREAAKERLATFHA